ncbi:CEBPD protein, partial [Burhinus bistriatus]|nr:CEBPD protein [Burhinus bistriatus]
AAALYSLDSPACYKSWCLEPANFYDAKVGAGGGPGPACKAGGRGGCGMSGEEAGGGLGGSGTNLAELSAAAPAMYEDESAIDFSSYIDSMSAQEPDWSDSDLSSSLLPSQIATCAQTIMNLSGQPTPPTSPEPPGSSSPSSCSTRSPGPAAAAVSGSGQGVPPPPAAGGKERGGKEGVDRSRDKAKRRNQEMQQKLLELSAENEKLHKKIEQLTRDLTSLRHFFKQLPSASFLQPGSGTDCR